MNDAADGWAGIKRTLGQRVAPPRFVLFAVVCLAGAALLWPVAGRAAR